MSSQKLLTIKWLHLACCVCRACISNDSNPYKLTFAVTRRCNYRCRHCQVWRFLKDDELTLDEIKRFAVTLQGMAWIDFTGGEPTLREDFADIVEVFQARCRNLIFIHFPTNGSNPEEADRICRRILAGGRHRLVVTVSIDGPPDLHDDLRGMPGAFESAARTFGLLGDIKGMDVYAGMTLYPENIHAVNATIKAIQRVVPGFEPSRLHVNLPYQSAHLYCNQDYPPAWPNGIGEAIAEVIALPGGRLTPLAWMERRYRYYMMEFAESRRCPLPCKALNASCFVAADGTVYPCSIWDSPLGNLRDTAYSLNRLLQSASAQRARAAIRKEQCPQCWTACDAFPTMLEHLFRVSLEYYMRKHIAMPK